MDIRELELLVAVVDLSSVTNAARKMNLSPGAVSLRLRNLAVELNTDLFVRSGRKLAPTSAALRLAEHGRALLRQMQQIQQEFANDPQHDTHPFHFATGATTLIYHLGGPLRRLRRNYPNAVLELTVATTEEIVTGLLNRRFDLGLISLPYSQEGLRVTPLFEEEMLIVRPSQKRISGWHVGSITVAELASVPFVLNPKRSNMRTIIDSYFQRLGLTPRVLTEADDTEALKRLVEAGFGYSMLPESALRSRAKSRFFQVFRISGRQLFRTQALAMAQTGRPRALTESIAGFLHNALVAR